MNSERWKWQQLPSLLWVRTVLAHSFFGAVCSCFETSLINWCLWGTRLFFAIGSCERNVLQFTNHVHTLIRHSIIAVHHISNCYFNCTHFFLQSTTGLCATCVLEALTRHSLLRSCLPGLPVRYYKATLLNRNLPKSTLNLKTELHTSCTVGVALPEAGTLR